MSITATFIGEDDLKKSESKAHFLPQKWKTRAFPWKSEPETHNGLTDEWIRKKGSLRKKRHKLS